MLKELDASLDYKKDVWERLQRILEQLRRNNGSILLHTIQWTSITAVCFLLVYGIGTLALYTISPYKTRPAHSDLQADYGEWPIVFVARVDPDIVEEIKKDNPQNPGVFMNPEEIDPYEDPFVIQGQSGNGQPPAVETPLPTAHAPDSTNTRSPNRSPTSTPNDIESPTPTPTLVLTVTPTSTPVPTQQPTNTPLPPTPTSPPPTAQPLVTICHKPGEPNEKTIRVPQANVADHLAHGDYIGECGSQ